MVDYGPLRSPKCWRSHLCAITDTGRSHSGESTFQRLMARFALWVFQRPLRTTHSSSSSLGWAEVTHPFHPLLGFRCEVLKVRKVSGVDSLSLRHPEFGIVTVSREWTDQSLATDWSADSPVFLDAGHLLQLLELIRHLSGRGVDV
jgi:hypothetical protein